MGQLQACPTRSSAPARSTTRRTAQLREDSARPAREPAGTACRPAQSEDEPGRDRGPARLALHVGAGLDPRGDPRRPQPGRHDQPARQREERHRPRMRTSSARSRASVPPSSGTARRLTTAQAAQRAGGRRARRRQAGDRVEARPATVAALSIKGRSRRWSPPSRPASSRWPQAAQARVARRPSRPSSRTADTVVGITASGAGRVDRRRSAVDATAVSSGVAMSAARQAVRLGGRRPGASTAPGSSM